MGSCNSKPVVNHVSATNNNNNKHNSKSITPVVASGPTAQSSSLSTSSPQRRQRDGDSISSSKHISTGSSPTRKKQTSNDKSIKRRRSSGVKVNGSSGPVAQNGGSRKTNGYTGHAPVVDDDWAALFTAFSDSIIDPADVHAVMEEQRASMTDRLSPSEITFIQRRVREVVRQISASPTAATTMVMGLLKGNGGKSSAGDQSRAVYSKEKIMDENVIRMIFDGSSRWLPQAVDADDHKRQEAKIHEQSYGGLDADGSPRISKRKNLPSGMSKLDPIGNAYLLMLHLAESEWDHVAELAEVSAKDAGLEMDVNKGPRVPKKIPPPIPETFAAHLFDDDSLPPLPSGVSLSSLCFFMALALRGTRTQRLQLLFYLLMPHKKLTSVLSTHPSGRVPTWLLEVGNESVLSLASLSHYYYYGKAFLPNSSFEADHTRHGKLGKKISARSSVVVEFLLALLKDTELRTMKHVNSTPEVATEIPVSRTPSGVNLSSLTNLRKKGSSATDTEASQHDSSKPQISELSQCLKDVREGNASFPFGEKATASLSQWQGAAALTGNSNFWKLEDFVNWADVVLDDDAIDVIMNKLFATGTLPNHSLERDLVLKRWMEWQRSEARLLGMELDAAGAVAFISKSVTKFFMGDVPGADADRRDITLQHAPWGGLGGIDGRGGLGHGIFYCLDKKWWDEWIAYVGWKWDGETDVESVKVTRTRPQDLSNEALLDRSRQAIHVLGGTLGSYELMKHGLEKDVDFVLVPPGVWDVLYEMYGGGPPLPRMMLSPPKDLKDSLMSSDGESVEVVAPPSPRPNVPPLKIPKSVAVALHPWVFHCHPCDPQQPYRRGDAGPISIRLMAMPHQPFWRVLAEIFVRLPVTHRKARNESGEGKIRIWKRNEGPAVKGPAGRYGPWTLLCKSRHATLPAEDLSSYSREAYAALEENWNSYADSGTVESLGLDDGDKLMYEYAVVNKAGSHVWPREAAAKAGREKRQADEDRKFRRTLRGLDDAGKLIKDALQSIVGMSVDAMDASGRWYEVDIIQVDNKEDEDDDDESSEGEGQSSAGSIEHVSGENKAVRVNFNDVGAHEEWISIGSDRLAVAGRFTLDSMNASDPTPEGKTQNGAEGKASKTTNTTTATSSTTTKKGNRTDSLVDVSGPGSSSGTVCLFPGYGACGLSNLGNTCYANSAFQCLSYMPMIRAYLLSGQFKTSGNLNKDNPLGTGGKLLEAFAELLRNMWSTKQGVFAPTRFRSQLGKAQSQFAAADQQDAQELLNYMLDVLHEDSNKVKKKPYVEAPEDDWVKNNPNPRVGQEIWRRFLRRNRSIIADVAMGQVLNTVTCPKCSHSSRNFDPFNMLSIPCPTIADVVFRCTVIRKASAANCANGLNLGTEHDDSVGAYDSYEPPSVHSIAEQYVIEMSRLADISDLRAEIQKLSGIPIAQSRLYKSEEIVVDADAAEKNPVRSCMKIMSQADRDGPCINLAKTVGKPTHTATSTPTNLVVFESTLKPRPMPPSEITDETDEDGDTDEEEEEEEPPIPRRQLEEHLEFYGDEKECRVYDTDPLIISKAISRSLWPNQESEFKLGLRVDAIDRKNQWYTGSVVEIVEAGHPEMDDEDSGDNAKTKTHVKVHFDNFASKWDETYTIDHFNRGRVRPLCSHAKPRAKPTEFLVHHRHNTRETKGNVLFGQPFYMQCQNEWSTARAGAHILAQTCRFLQTPGNLARDDETISSENLRAREKASVVISDTIDLLVKADKEYIESALGKGADGERFVRNPKFDANVLSSSLNKRLCALLTKLPFEIRVCTNDNPLGGKQGTASDEVAFPFSLIRTIGNYMNARNAIVLHWRKEKHLSAVLYISPRVNIHKRSASLLKTHASVRGGAHKDGKKKGHSVDQGGIHLGVCLTEFCKEQQLHLQDNWRCPRCKDFREGRQSMTVWKLPDLLTFHIKRFNCSARWREKITTRVDFPLTGLDMSEWCSGESPAVNGAKDSYVYDLIGVMNHFGGMTGGHYVAVCKATACGPDGSEEVANNFNGAGTNEFSLADEAVPGIGWRLGRSKDKDAASAQSKAAAAASRSASESAEPLWLQFDDDLVEPIPPHNVVSEMAYVLFYRRRRISPSNVAKYSSLE